VVKIRKQNAISPPTTAISLVYQSFDNASRQLLSLSLDPLLLLPDTPENQAIHLHRTNDEKSLLSFGLYLAILMIIA
jgi:hypothetical protein